MTYIIKTMSGSIIKITREEYEKIRHFKSGLIHLNSGKSFNASSVDSIIPESDYLIKQSDKNRGVLHDGQRVINRFGAWYVDDGSFQIRVDPQYYPEVAKNCVVGLEEFKQKYEQLSPKERLKLMLPHKKEKEEVSVEGQKKYKALKGKILC